MRVDVIATTMSGSISDWKKVERILPLFASHGYEDVRLHVCESHEEARSAAARAVSEGGQRPISAGGSGTFRAVLEGCMEAKADLDELRLGFLRKGSADLIGKVLEMPDEIEEAISVFARSLKEDQYSSADLLRASSPFSREADRHFLGYGGAEIFGRIPHYTENRFTKYYKGILSQFFGDLGPFTTGMALALVEHVLKSPFRRKREWEIRVDGEVRERGSFRALILVNGYLGPELPFSKAPLGSGDFHLFGLKDLGLRILPTQARKARSGKILEDPDLWGLKSWTAEKSIVLAPKGGGTFPVNVDGATFRAHDEMRFERVGSVKLMSR
ncbi:MAG: diacylglycerol kinase family protein [Candidatus Krumholzibacteria bacterium]|nr:diacylglycerol kinase family protein [Candidatus Krumholzibacteria bacterium]MDP7022448.1 diacylglycerol kinase family protein [Candidatus Krumholzibacteria bacterium]